SRVSCANIPWPRDNDRDASRSQRHDDQEQGRGVRRAQKCATGTPHCYTHAPISLSEHPYTSRVSRARSGEERLVRPIVGHTTVESARVWLTVEAKPYARERTRSVPNPTRRALSVSSRPLLDPTIQPRCSPSPPLFPRV